MFRSLRFAGLIQRVHDIDAGYPIVRVAPELQSDFSLHQSLSFYLVDAVALLDPEEPDYAMNLLSLVEAILENPRQILAQQVSRAKGELIARLKAEGVPYEERIAKLDEATHPKPLADFVYATFNAFVEKHPWFSEQNVRPKSVAREMWEHYDDFADFVRRYGLERSEGLRAPLSLAGPQHARAQRARVGVHRRRLRRDRLPARADRAHRLEPGRRVGEHGAARRAARGEGRRGRSRGRSISRAIRRRSPRGSAPSCTCWCARSRPAAWKTPPAACARIPTTPGTLRASKPRSRRSSQEYGRIVFDGRARLADQTTDQDRRAAPLRGEPEAARPGGRRLLARRVRSRSRRREGARRSAVADAADRELTRTMGAMAEARASLWTLVGGDRRRCS